MSEITEADIVQRQKRQKRVQNLKRLIIVSLFAAILIPIILCVILFVRLNHVEKQLLELQAKIKTDQMTEKQVEVEDALAKQETKEQQKLVEAKEPDSEEQNQVSEDKIHVYLTFDDGPSANTGAILDILDSYGVKATFFVVGKPKERYDALYKRITDEGHSIGMHSYSHKYQEIYADLDGFSDDLQKLQDFILEKTGVLSTISRFPGGSSNTVSKVDMQELITYLNEKGITYYDWNVSSLDAENGKISVNEIVENVTGNIQNYKNAVVLMHDAADKVSTVEALPIVIERLLQMKNVEILPITDDTVRVQHNIQK